MGSDGNTETRRGNSGFGRGAERGRNSWMKFGANRPPGRVGAAEGGPHTSHAIGKAALIRSDSAALLGQKIGGLVSGFLDEKTHLGMRRLKIGLNPLPL